MGVFVGGRVPVGVVVFVGIFVAVAVGVPFRVGVIVLVLDGVSESTGSKVSSIIGISELGGCGITVSEFHMRTKIPAAITPNTINNHFILPVSIRERKPALIMYDW